MLDCQGQKKSRFPKEAAVCAGKCEQSCKPGSVFGNHLSGTRVAARLKPSVGTDGPPIAPVDVAADRVYRPPMSPWGVVSSYLAFPPLPGKPGGISLLHYSWGRPRQTLSAIPALRSPDFPHAGRAGTRLPGLLTDAIIASFSGSVKPFRRKLAPNRRMYAEWPPCLAIFRQSV